MPASATAVRKRPLMRRARHVVRNARDRFLRTETLVLANQTAFDVVHDNGLVQLRHYHPLTESSVLMDGHVMPVAAQRAATASSTPAKTRGPRERRRP